MKIGLRSSHAYSYYSGGFQALKWHILACRALGHDTTFLTAGSVSKEVLENWIDGVPIRYYLPHCEKDYDIIIDVDHFSNAFPEAKIATIKHVFFPQPNTPQPAEGVRLYSNSAYTARHIKQNWGRDAVPMYIPIDPHFRSGDKQNVILHVSRFTEPSVYADKAHRQMIQAFKIISRRLPGWKLSLVGSIDPAQEFYLDSLVRLAAGYNIDFLPNVTNKKIAELYAVSSVYWHATGVSLPTTPSAQEHMGIAPIEAQASGCVPICYNSGGIPEVVLNGRTGLLFDNIMDLPNMTIDLIEHLDRWSALSQAGQIWGSERADFDAFVVRIDDMLNDRPITPIPDFKLTLKYRQEDVTIVIPTYNSPLLDRCLTSLAVTAPKAHVLVINNGDALEPEVMAHDGVEFWDTGKNLGFAGANRVAKDLVKTPLVMMMNDDVEATKEHWLEYLMLLFNHETVGVVGPKLLFPDGRLQFAGGKVDWNRADTGFHRMYGAPDCIEASTPTEVDFITGAALLCKSELFEMPTQLDGTINFEDTWLCFAAREAGYKVVYQPASVMVHHEGQTKKRTPDIQEKVDAARDIFRNRWMR